MVEIRTERLLLRRAREDDLASFHAILSDARSMAFWYCPPHDDLNVTQEWLAAMIEIDRGTGEDFAVEYEGRVIGKAGLRKFPVLGFIFHPDVWGRGLASEAVRPIIDRAFNTHGLPMIEADVDPRNTSSLKLLNRLGFVETGRAQRTSLVGSEWCDSVYLRRYSTDPNVS
ncbi:ribosomal-protein-S5-alanine N-acetyltransferase [compost metagenome]